MWEEQQLFLGVGEHLDGAHAQGRGASESSESHPREGLPRYDWQGKGTAQMVGEMPRYEYSPVGGSDGRADPMAIGRVVVGQTAWDKLTAHPTSVSPFLSVLPAPGNCPLTMKADEQDTLDRAESEMGVGHIHLAPKPWAVTIISKAI